YVTNKDMKKNEIYVTTDISDNRLWHKELTLTNEHWINKKPAEGAKLQVRTRHRAPLIDCDIHHTSAGTLITLKDDIRALTPGQSAVLYDNDTVLGGGIII